MLVLGLVSLILHNSMRLHVSQCFHCLKTDNVRKNAFLALVLKFNALHVSQCFHCLKTDNNAFLAHITSFYAEKRVQTQGNACFRPSLPKSA